MNPACDSVAAKEGTFGRRADAGSPALMSSAAPSSRFRPVGERNFGEVRALLHAGDVQPLDDRPFGKISTDSRTLQPGEVFLALKGENFDGQAYVRAAVERGASGLIVGRDYPADHDATLPVLRVEDPLRALGDLAADQRRAWGGPVIALSGSMGKTTTRRLIAHGLGRHRAVLEPIRNFNNLIGLPTTLLRLDRSHEVAVLEIGINMPGEMERLTEIAAPNVAGLTRLGPTHVGMFGSMEALIEAKFGIFRHSPAGAVFVVNAECRYSGAAVRQFGREHAFVTFRGEGRADAEYRIENAAIMESGGYRFDLVWPGGRASGARIEIFGRHVLEDIAAAAAFLGAAGYDPSWAVESLADFHTEPMRGQIVRAGEWTFILDCYNGAPDAMMSALESLRDLPGKGRTVLVLADMGELGEFTGPLHDRLIDPIVALRPGLMVSLGEQFGRISENLRAAGVAAENFGNREALIERLRGQLETGDRVFFKGSRRSELERVALALAGEIPELGNAH